MSPAINLFSSKFDIDADYLKHLQPIGHLSSAYLQVLLHSSRFKTLSAGEKITSQSVKNSIVYLLDGCVEKPQAKGVQHIESGGVEPLFEGGEIAEVIVKQKSMLLMMDKTLYGIFEKEYRFREKLNMAMK